ncbi:Golgi-associated plant pathogenesis-related protein 1 [Orchesella cincta]|uniref:Golgi-associated plant pathogenesis-related protein 1 n=1 Tax=Orchesella cincta TaxID=48709 RepID=A0A1D2MJC5_ORCCI|nr:Golgi-associated plant pathogenesis-related protein 1 [Orchesella cincta]
MGYQQKALDDVNTNRAKHSAPAMKMDASLNTVALQCAEFYAQKGKVDRTCPYHNSTTGENLFGIKGKFSEDVITKLATTAWMAEAKNYDFLKPNFLSSSTKQFTQLIWKESDKMGFGVAQKNGYATAVSAFSPAGNVAGKFLENVFSGSPKLSVKF